MTKENKKKVLMILLGIILLVGWFYWFQYRPAQIRSYCHRQANEKATLTTKEPNLIDKYYPKEKKNLYERLTEESGNKISSKDYIFLYDICLHEKGLK